MTVKSMLRKIDKRRNEIQMQLLHWKYELDYLNMVCFLEEKLFPEDGQPHDRANVREFLNNQIMALARDMGLCFIYEFVLVRRDMWCPESKEPAAKKVPAKKEAEELS